MIESELDFLPRNVVVYNPKLKKVISEQFSQMGLRAILSSISNNKMQLRKHHQYEFHYLLQFTGWTKPI